MRKKRTWTSNACEDTCPPDDYGGDFLVIPALTQLVNHRKSVAQEEFGPKWLGRRVAHLFPDTFKVQSRGGWMCFAAATQLLLRCWCHTTFPSQPCHHFHSPCWVCDTQQSNCPTSTLLHSDIMKHCHPHNILWHFYNTWQQVGKWLLLTGANGKITHIWKAVLCVVFFPLAYNSRWARSLLLLRGLWKHRCNMCQSSSSLREDTVVAILILQIADTTVALLHNLDASLCAIKVMQHGLHKGTS